MKVKLKKINRNILIFYKHDCMFCIKSAGRAENFLIKTWLSNKIEAMDLINRNNTGTEKSERNCHSQKYIPVRRQNMVG